MRITTSDGYRHGFECPLSDCERHYCSEHRLLYRDCDTAYRDGMDDADVPGGFIAFWSSEGECPNCVQEAKIKRFREYQELGGINGNAASSATRSQTA